jgi:putative transcriptional regulator
MIRILLSARLGDRRMTQSELARSTGIRGQTINELYHEIAERVSLDQLDLICEALDCDLSDLLVREPNEERRVKSVHSTPTVRYRHSNSKK